MSTILRIGRGRDDAEGQRWLRMALAEVALAAIRTRDSAFGARYRRVIRHRGHKKPVVGGDHSLRTIYHGLAEPMNYREPGAEHERQLGLVPHFLAEDWEAWDVHLRPLRKRPRAVWKMPC